jgi:hypothetical protein
MSLLLLFSGEGGGPPVDATTQHLLLALQWTPEAAPPAGDPQQHLLLALQWTPGEVPPVEPPVVLPSTGSGAGWGKRVRQPLDIHKSRKRPDDDAVLVAFMTAYMEWEVNE